MGGGGVVQEAKDNGNVLSLKLVVLTFNICTQANRDSWNVCAH